MDELLLAAYQELLELEYQKVIEVGLEEPPNPASFLSDEEVKTICQKHGVNFEQLTSDLLVQYPGIGWRTMHFDLIYRLVHIRNRENGTPIPLEYKIEMRSEPVPDFDRHKFSEILPKLIADEPTLKAVLAAFEKSKYKGLSSYQLPIVKELISDERKYESAAIVAPTASGKTLAFFLPVIINAVHRVIEGKTGISSILIYPRKALERDQLQTFLAIIASINQVVPNQITIGIDDGDTKKNPKDIENGEHYREMKCLYCSSPLIIEKKDGGTKVKCSNCSKEYPYIIATKDEIREKRPTILITNIHTIYRRLLTPSAVKMFAGIDYIVFDEAHVYTDYLGGHVFYIIKILRHAAKSNGRSPYLVFSSATIPNPLEFIAKLTGLKTDEIFYIDYTKTLEKLQDIRRRLLLYLYLLPHPDSSVETLTEALMLAVALWCHRHNLKAITFVDSIGEISTLSDYIYTTILGHRQGREVTDHLQDANYVVKSYNWFSLAPRNEAKDLDTFKRFVLTHYKASIGMHYGQLPLSQRAKIEYDFSKGNLKLLLSTSTLELGIDLSDVAAIIQHKLPITPEGVVQRVGRSGRSPESLRVALGIIALQSSPLSTLYMFDEKLRNRLADPNLLPPPRVGQASASIMLQQVFTLLLYKWAIEGKPTFIEEYLKSKQEVINVVNEIENELNDELIEFNKQVGLFDNEKVLRTSINELRSLLSTILDTIKEPVHGDFGQIKNEWENILAEVENNTKIIREKIKQLEEVKNIFIKIQPLNNVLNEVESLQDLLIKASSLCNDLIKIAKSSYRAGDSGEIEKWYKVKSKDIEAIARSIPDSDTILSKVLTPLNDFFKNTIKNDYAAFRAKYGFGYDVALNQITNITKSLGSDKNTGLSHFLQQLPNKVEFLQSVDLAELIAYESLMRVENELKLKPRGIDIFTAINLLLRSKARFSLMLEPPSPELELASDEEV